MSLEADILQTEREGDPAPSIEPEPVVAAPVDEDAALDQEIAEQTIDLPEGEKLVPLSAVTTLRGKLSEAKTALKTATEGSTKQAQLEQTVQQLQARITEWQPYVQ